MTRSFGLDCRAEGRTPSPARSPPTAGGWPRARSRPSEIAEAGPTHNDPPLVNHRHFPRLAAGRHDDPAVHELVRAKSTNRSISPIHEGTATLELFGAPNEEHDRLAPVRMGSGFRFQFAYTVEDLETVAEL